MLLLLLSMLALIQRLCCYHLCCYLLLLLSYAEASNWCRAQHVDLEEELEQPAPTPPVKASLKVQSFRFGFKWQLQDVVNVQKRVDVLGELLELEFFQHGRCQVVDCGTEGVAVGQRGGRYKWLGSRRRGRLQLASTFTTGMVRPMFPYSWRSPLLHAVEVATNEALHRHPLQ